MSTTYAISVENERGENANYAVFMEPPEFTGGLHPWMNVWYTTFVPYHGSFEIRTGTDFYAWTGTVPTSPAPGVVVNSGMNQLARLGSTSAPGSTFDEKIIQQFPTIEEVNPSAILGAFEIKTGSDFSMPNNNYLVGLGKVNNRGQIAPVATVAPRNNMNIQITPRLKFYVSEGHQVPGEIVDQNAIMRDGATIDFSGGPGLGKFFARVVQNSDGRFNVTYYDRFD